MAGLLVVSNAVMYIAIKKVTSIREIATNHNPMYKFLMADTFEIANETMPYLRQGLNRETAHQIAVIIRKITQVSAVAITDRECVLAYIGAGCDKHLPGDAILTKATKDVIKTGRSGIFNSSTELDCPRKDCLCPLSKAVIVPLKSNEQVVGTLKLYQTEDGELPSDVIKLAKEIAQLLSTQIEIAELNRHSHLVTQAKLEALNAQINPHFLFNTLNTIIAFSRTDPHKTRHLLIHLADFFRHALKKHEPLISLREELEYINIYLVLEKARFSDKLKIVQKIDPELLSCPLPVLSLQPIVENAIKHGISSKIEGGTVEIIAEQEGDNLVAMVIDDGIGIPPHQLGQILTPGYGSGNGVGLSNVDERLKRFYGVDNGIRVSSVVNQGTKVKIVIPIEKGMKSNTCGKEGEGEDEVQGIDCG